jgi:hypothetical protein
MHFSSQMKKLNDEQSFIVNDILLKKPKAHQNLYIFFLSNCAGRRKTFTLMCIIQDML